jgi:hypothetical protein
MIPTNSSKSGQTPLSEPSKLPHVHDQTKCDGGKHQPAGEFLQQHRPEKPAKPGQKLTVVHSAFEVHDSDIQQLGHNLLGGKVPSYIHIWSAARSNFNQQCPVFDPAAKVSASPSTSCLWLGGTTDRKLVRTVPIIYFSSVQPGWLQGKLDSLSQMEPNSVPSSCWC